MKAGGGKSKGSAFERKICKELSLWVSAGSSEDLFWRSALSGGRATIAIRKGKKVRQAGDICSVQPEGHLLTDVFFIECKCYRHLAVDRFLLTNAGPLAGFWRLCKEQATEHDRLPMLIAKENGRPIIVITEVGQLNSVCDAEGAITKDPEVRPFNTVLGYKFHRKG